MKSGRLPERAGGDQIIADPRRRAAHRVGPDGPVFEQDPGALEDDPGAPGEEPQASRAEVVAPGAAAR